MAATSIPIGARRPRVPFAAIWDGNAASGSAERNGLGMVAMLRQNAAEPAAPQQRQPAPVPHPRRNIAESGTPRERESGAAASENPQSYIDHRFREPLSIPRVCSLFNPRQWYNRVSFHRS